MFSPICTECKREMRCTAIGVQALYVVGGRDQKITWADEYTCPDCEYKVIAGFAKEPMYADSPVFGAAKELGEKNGTLRLVIHA